MSGGVSIYDIKNVEDEIRKVGQDDAGAAITAGSYIDRSDSVLSLLLNRIGHQDSGEAVAAASYLGRVLALVASAANLADVKTVVDNLTTNLATVDTNVDTLNSKFTSLPTQSSYGSVALASLNTWYPLFASSGFDSVYILLSFSNANIAGQIDLATGGAGSEVVKVSLRKDQVSGSSIEHILIPFKFANGSRISIRTSNGAPTAYATLLG